MPPLLLDPCQGWPPYEAFRAHDRQDPPQTLIFSTPIVQRGLRPDVEQQTIGDLLGLARLGTPPFAMRLRVSKLLYQHNQEIQAASWSAVLLVDLRGRKTAELNELTVNARVLLLNIMPRNWLTRLQGQDGPLALTTAANMLGIYSAASLEVTNDFMNLQLNYSAEQQGLLAQNLVQEYWQDPAGVLHMRVVRAAPIPTREELQAAMVRMDTAMQQARAAAEARGEAGQLESPGA